ncbi:hypothetical protein ACIQC9_10415 [Brevundimonas sp. NPDC092305]|uniref:hypothetical protein n=1 Tax=Brevundimonas sp. NPDC092305 TaxID=3363957 RepID=UPI0038119257
MLQELTLDDMLADPIVQQVMARDGVQEADLRALVGRLPARVRPAEPRSFIDNDPEA